MDPIVIRNTQSPGDIIVLTAAIRDLSQTYPGRFRFGVDTIERPIWLHNPNVDYTLRAGKRIVAKYPLIHQSNQQKVHFMWGFLEYLNQQLGTEAKLLQFRPDLYLTDEEKKEPPYGLERPYWVFASGGKRDFTAKWWDPQEWAKVVAVMSRWTTMVQVGGGSHVHPPIANATNLIGRTTMRDLFRIIYHSEGVLCVVTCLMHIAAAFNKPCVVVAGGREPYHWEAYTHENRLVNMRRGQPMWSPPAGDNFVPHRFLHTVGTAPDNVGTLPCCDHHGCWSGRVGKRPPRDDHRYCKDYVARGDKNLPRCLSMITSERVLSEVEWYYTNNILDKKHPSTMVEMLVEPVKAEPKPKPKPAPKPEPPAKPVPAVTYEEPVAAIKVGALVNGEGITPSSIDRYGRIGAAIMDIKSRLNALRSFSAQSKEASWIGWMEDPISPRGRQWYNRMLAKLDKDPEAAWGTVCWREFAEKDKKKLSSRSWYSQPELPPHPLDPNRSILYYFKRGWLLLPKRLVNELPWEELSDEGFELELGAWLAQRNVKLRDAGELVEG